VKPISLIHLLERAVVTKSARTLSLALILAGITFPVCAEDQSTNTSKHQLSREDFQRIEKKWGATSLETVQKAAEEGRPEAMYELYRRFIDGTGVMENDEQAKGWLAKAAAAGNAPAQSQFGYQYEHPNNYSRDDRQEWRTNNMPEAVRWYRLSVSQNYPGGQCCLGLCYLEGKGVEQDEERGLDLIRKAADQGQSYSLVKLAGLYREGVGESRNEKDQPIQLLLRAAEADFKDAYEPLIARYRRGVGTDRDLIIASEWYCRAARSNSRYRPLKSKVLDLTPAKARQTDPFSVALSLYLKAVKLNDPDAATRIGGMYAAGRDVQQSPAKAWQWFNLAIQRGSSEAAKGRDAVEKRMTSNEIAEARQRAGAFGKELVSIAMKLHWEDR
jgi:TPR repeat protein